MKRLGKVLHLSSNKNLILKTTNTPRSKKRVFDKRVKPVGEIIDVFGPVKNPFVSIRPMVEKPEKYVGKALYLVNK